MLSRNMSRTLPWYSRKKILKGTAPASIAGIRIASSRGLLVIGKARRVDGETAGGDGNHGEIERIPEREAEQHNETGNANVRTR